MPASELSPAQPTAITAYLPDTTLGLFFALGEPFGSLNDAIIVVQYLLALPLILALHRLLHRPGHLLSTFALLLGMGRVPGLL